MRDGAAARFLGVTVLAVFVVAADIGLECRR
jgi:hypothetical protein